MAVFGTDTKKKTSNGRTTAHPDAPLSTVAPGTVLDGTLISEGILRVDGKLTGSVVCRSRLVVGVNGVIEGNVDAHTATIEGTIQGRVMVRELLQIQEKGKIKGDIVCKRFVMQAGGTFTGSCTMGEQAEQLMKQRPQAKTIAEVQSPTGNGSPSKPVNLDTPSEPDSKKDKDARIDLPEVKKGKDA